jgi:hypothetical protein
VNCDTLEPLHESLSRALTELGDLIAQAPAEDRVRLARMVVLLTNAQYELVALSAERKARPAPARAGGGGQKRVADDVARV